MRRDCKMKCPFILILTGLNVGPQLHSKLQEFTHNLNMHNVGNGAQHCAYLG